VIPTTEPPRFLDVTYEFYQPSIDVFHGRIAMAGLAVDEPYGVACLEYSVATGEWYALGGTENVSQYLEPNTLRISSQDGYVAYFGSFYPYDDPSGVYSLRIGAFIFDRGNLPRFLLGWEDDGTAATYDLSDYNFYNSMDCYGSRLACLAPVKKVLGVVLNKFQIKVSNDSAETFGTTWTFPDVFTPLGIGGYSDKVELRMTQDGIVHVAYLRSGGLVGTHNIEYWKSNAAATSWTKIWENNFYADLGNVESYGLSFDLNDEDGETIVIRLKGIISGAPTLYRDLAYLSTNYGVAFTAYPTDYPSAPAWEIPYIVGTSNELDVVHFCDVGVYKSTNGGSTYNLIDISPIPITGSFVDQQKHHSEIVYTECGVAFSPPGADPNLQGLLYSDDDGSTWQVIQSPLPLTVLLGDDYQVPLYPGYTEDYSDLDNVVITDTGSGGTITWSTNPDLFINRPARWVILR
jgi:hypothetical protein